MKPFTRGRIDAILRDVYPDPEKQRRRRLDLLEGLRRISEARGGVALPGRWARLEAWEQNAYRR